MTREERRAERHGDNSRVSIGLFLLIIGGILLAGKMGAPLPGWLFNWHFILIAVGLFIGIRHRFHGVAWFILLAVGGFLLMDDYNPAFEIRRYMAPIILIGIGLIFVFRPRRNKKNIGWQPGNEHNKEEWKERYNKETTSADEYLDVVTILSGIKKNILSKDFKGGEATSFLGGTEINLSQADINGRVVLELTQVLGGTKLIVPPHWDIKPELVSFFGGIEDKRPLTGTAVDPSKVLILKGTSVFGGIEIRSY